MSENLRKAIACFKQLGLTPEISNFTDRLLMQKYCYLLEKMNVDLGFAFKLYLRGPYSRSLTLALYENARTVELLQTDCKLNSTELKAIEKLKAIAGGNPIQLEIIATYEYLTSNLGKQEDDAIRTLKALKPFYSEADFAVGVSSAKRLFFNPQEKLLADVAKETREWDALSDEALRKAG